MVGRRMARGRARTHEILAFDLARRHAARGSRRYDQAALAHRTRLRGTEERTRPRPFRGAGLARIPSSREPLHRRLRISDPRELGLSPLRPLAPQKTCRFRPYSILTRRRSVPKDT